MAHTVTERVTLSLPRPITAELDWWIQHGAARSRSGLVQLALKYFFSHRPQPQDAATRNFWTFVRPSHAGDWRTWVEHRDRVTVSVPPELYESVSTLLGDLSKSNRSRVYQEALASYLAELRRTRLANEADKLDIDEERDLAEEAVEVGNTSWPEY